MICSSTTGSSTTGSSTTGSSTTGSSIRNGSAGDCSIIFGGSSGNAGVI